MDGYLAFLPVALEYWNKDQDSAYSGNIWCISLLLLILSFGSGNIYVFEKKKKLKYKKSCARIFSVKGVCAKWLPLVCVVMGSGLKHM